MAWFKKVRKPIESGNKESRVPEGLWVKCPSCAQIIYNKDLAASLSVCTKCAHHFRLGASDRLRSLFDGPWQEHDAALRSTDPLRFTDTKPYHKRLETTIAATGLMDAVITASGQIGGMPAVVAAMEYSFIGGSMGVVVGEKITRAIEIAIDRQQPVIIVSCSGGARMMEGALSLMQMAKISAALARLDRARLPYISILTDPTTGGVTASFAMLGDVNIAEPKALIGFAGPRVIEQTIRQKLPEGFQRSEFLLDHGMLDMVVDRRELKDLVIRVLRFGARPVPLAVVAAGAAPAVPLAPRELTTDPFEYLFGLERLGMKFGLENISKLCAALSHPERSFSSVLVAGTNGKGSVTAMVHRGLREAGLLAARYTSPHLERLEERFVIGDREVETAALGDALSRVRAAVEALQRSGGLDAPPTFFECATAAAFELFREARVDVAVLEVGLGGRLDATNVVAPAITAITSIGFDHQAQLGHTLESIAFEKAGIVRAGVPLVCGEVPAEAARVISRICAERGAPLTPASECGNLERWIGSAPLALAGRHQRGNAAVAACVLRTAASAGLPIGEGAIRAALTDVAWPARLERFHHGSAEVLLDAAHNPDGARALAAFLHESDWTGCALIFGAMRDKAVGEMLAALAPVCGALFCTTADTPRALPAEAIAEVAAQAGAAWTVAVIPDPGQALETAARGFGRVVVAGSIFLTGPVRGILRPR